MLQKRTKQRGQIQMLCIDELVPKDHLVRQIDAALDFSFIYNEVRDLYADEIGRPSIDPVVLFKLPIIQYLFGIRSMRQTIREIEVNNAYRWFLGLDFFDAVPHFTTFGKNYVRRFAETANCKINCPEKFTRSLKPQFDLQIYIPRFVEGSCSPSLQSFGAL